MFLCPHCRGTLARTSIQSGIVWVCGRCGGRAMSLGLLRKTAPKTYLDRLWQAAGAGREAGRPCPACDRPMRQASGPAPAAPTLDVCRLCQFVWFDPREFAQLPPLPPPPAEPELPPEARQALAMVQVELIAERAREAPQPADEWKIVAGVLGLPVEWEEGPLARAPWLTWGIVVAIALVSLVAFFDLRRAIDQWGLLPAEPWRHGGLTFLTSFLLHGGALHLLGNLYFLLIFGDNVEDYLGRRPYATLVALAALVGDFCHVSWDPRPGIPVIGASGGIAGVITFYALRFPHARLGILLRFGALVRWLRMPAWLALVVWILLQVVGAWQQVAGVTTVSALAHLGGASVGFVFWLAWRTT